MALLALVLGGVLVVVSAALFPAAAGPLPFGAESCPTAPDLPVSQTHGDPAAVAVVRPSHVLGPSLPALPALRHVPWTPPAAATACAAPAWLFYQPQGPPAAAR